MGLPISIGFRRKRALAKRLVHELELEDILRRAVEAQHVFEAGHIEEVKDGERRMHTDIHARRMAILHRIEHELSTRGIPRDVGLQAMVNRRVR